MDRPHRTTATMRSDRADFTAWIRRGLLGLRMVPEPGTLIGARYRLERLVAEGGMGVVWAAEDIRTGQRCAVKLMKDASTPQLRERFLHEGRMASRVSHDHVVRILEVVEPENGSPAIVMELLDGESLRAVLERDHKLALAVLADIMVPVVSAVGTAHAHGIVHRDLKPENIFLVSLSRVVKVLDFGIAKLTPLDGKARRSTGNTTGIVWGTPRYMAPEQAAGAKADHRADVWSLGIVLYECLSGVCPTAGDDVLQVLTNVAMKPFEPLRKLAPEVPERIAQLVTRMLSRKPSERPTLHEVLEALEPFAATPGGRFGDPAPSPDAFAPTVAVVPLRARRKLVRIGVAMVSLVAATAVYVATSWRRHSPLDAPDAKLACPVLRASGVEDPAGWLGAAAAAVACERARVVLGGRKERTLVPAELLGLPVEPSDAFPSDPYGKVGAVEASLTAARRRSQAYLDGEVTWTSPSFTVKLSFHAADGTELGRAEAQGAGLYEAVRAAMAPLVDDGWIPKAAELDPQIAAWSLTRSVDDALGLIDLTFAIAHNAGGLVNECQRFEEISPRLRELGAEGRWLCAYVLGRESPELKLDTAAQALPVKATTIRIDHTLRRRSKPGDADLLRSKLASEATSRGQALLAVTASCLLHDKKDVARELALLAVKSEPSSAILGWCTPWGQLAALEQGTKREGAFRGRQAWQPWEPRGWAPREGFKISDKEALQQLQRARVLTPFDTSIADKAAIGYLRAGDSSAALGIASSLGAGGLPLHELEKKKLMVLIDASEAKFGKAIERARDIEIVGREADWIRAQRFELAWIALDLAVVLGEPRQAADAIVERFLDPDPPRVDPYGADNAARIPAVCVRASRPEPCFERFRSLRRQLDGLITQEMEDVIAGAERYSKNDLAGAAEKWRPLVPQSLVLDREMVETFDQTGKSDLAEKVDQAIMMRARTYNGATLGHARAARRAFEQGDLERARTLADQVIQAWGQADVEPPALADMRSLVAKLGKR
jgi:eukaryotic-like serine/threonine-protein kinase